MKTCKMTSHDGIDCNKPAKYVFIKDFKHVICMDCYLAFFPDDIDIAVEYVELAVSVYA